MIGLWPVRPMGVSANEWPNSPWAGSSDWQTGASVAVIPVPGNFGRWMAGTPAPRKSATRPFWDDNAD